MKLFETEEEAIKWVGMNIPLAIKPKDKRKTKYIFPFISNYALNIVVQELGEQLFKYQKENK